MVRQAWEFLREPRNLAVLALIGGATTFLWKIAEPRFFPLPKPAASDTRAAPKASSQVATAEGAGAQAINADDRATVGNPPQDVRAGATAPVEINRDQRAKAIGGGSAINASGQSRVVIDQSSGQKMDR